MFGLRRPLCDSLRIIIALREHLLVRDQIFQRRMQMFACKLHHSTEQRRHTLFRCETFCFRMHTKSRCNAKNDGNENTYLQNTENMPKQSG